MTLFEDTRLPGENDLPLVTDKCHVVIKYFLLWTELKLIKTLQALIAVGYVDINASNYTSYM